MSVNPKIKYFQNFTGDFDDVAKSKEATLAGDRAGRRHPLHILNLGCAAWSRRRRRKGTKIIGSYTDRCGTDPLYVGYSITGIGYMLQYAIDQALAGKWQPGYKAFGLAMGPQASGMKVCSASPEVQKKITETENAIREGKIKTLEG
jgi:basic membrane protein A